jgi:hypothetical protein
MALQALAGAAPVVEALSGLQQHFSLPAGRGKIAAGGPSGFPGLSLRSLPRRIGAADSATGVETVLCLETSALCFKEN